MDINPFPAFTLRHHKHNVKVDVDVDVGKNVTSEQGFYLFDLDDAGPRRIDGVHVEVLGAEPST